MVGQQIHPVALEVLEGLQVDRHDQPTPQVAQLALVPLDAQPHLLDVRAGLLEGLDGAADHLGDALVDREDVEVGAVGNPPAVDGLPHRRREALHKAFRLRFLASMRSMKASTTSIGDSSRRRIRPASSIAVM